MASAKKNQTAKKGTGRQGRPKKTQAPEPEQSFLGAEAAVIGSFVLAAFLFLSNFHLCGFIGDFFRGIQLGLFGLVGFVFPLLVFVGTAFYMSNRGNRTAQRKFLAALLLVPVCCALLQLAAGQELMEGESLLTFYTLSSENGSGGGLLGGALRQALGALAGTVGTFLILAALLILCLVCITERSFVGAVKKSGDRVYQYAREDIGRRRELQAERRAVREEKLRGVNLSSTDLSLDADLLKETAKPAAEEKRPEAAASEKKPAPVAAAVQPEPAASEEEKTKEPDPADVFTGVIHMPEYGRAVDEPPFEEDRPLSVNESAQRLVEEGSQALPDAEAGTGAAPFAKETLPAAERIPDTGKEAAEEKTPQQELPEIPASVLSEEDEIFMPGEEELPEETLADTVPYIPPTAEDDPPFETPEPEAEPAFAGEELPADGEIPVARDGRGSAERFEQQLPDDDGYEKPTESGGVFYVPGGERRVETASGKIIETDTEALQKKLESRRQQAKEESGEAGVAEEIRAKEEIPKREYVFPPTALLKKPERPVSRSDQEYRDTAVKLQKTLQTFGVGVTVTNISCGPSVTRYELHPEMGVKVSKIVGLADDIKLSLAAADIRIEAPIPGKSAVGIEVPNAETNTVYLRELLEADNFRNHGSRLAFAVGKDIGGQVVVADIAKMPHLLIAGATGSGKSVCINTLIMSIIFKSKPEDVKLILVDPKVVELSVYNGIPHLLIPVVTDPKKAAGALNWAVAEMTDRYKKFAKYGVRDLKGFNARVDNIKDIDDKDKPEKMPQIVIIIDELADLMMVASGEVEDAICRLAQLARACGIHLVIATQRPSVNVITGLIKANVPSRIAFSVSSGVDSRTILDMNGAEKLLGKGDMLFYPAGYPKPQRVQGAFVSDSEVQAVVDFLTEQGLTSAYDANVEKQLASGDAASQGQGKSSRDELFAEAGRFIIEKDKASIGMLQRMFKIGFNRAARIMDQLADAGVVGAEEGTKPRKILMSPAEFEEFLRL